MRGHESGSDASLQLEKVLFKKKKAVRLRTCRILYPILVCALHNLTARNKTLGIPSSTPSSFPTYDPVRAPLLRPAQDHRFPR